MEQPSSQSASVVILSRNEDNNESCWGVVCYSQDIARLIFLGSLGFCGVAYLPLHFASTFDAIATCFWGAMLTVRALFVGT